MTVVVEPPEVVELRARVAAVEARVMAVEARQARGESVLGQLQIEIQATRREVSELSLRFASIEMRINERHDQLFDGMSKLNTKMQQIVELMLASQSAKQEQYQPQHHHPKEL